MTSNSIIFKNYCKTLPIIVSSWMYKLPGLSEYIDIEILSIMQNIIMQL